MIELEQWGIRINQGKGIRKGLEGLEGQWMGVDALAGEPEPEKEAFARTLHQRAVGQDYVAFTVAEILEASDKLGMEYPEDKRKALEEINGWSINVPAVELLNLKVIRAQVFFARTARTMLELGVSNDG